MDKKVTKKEYFNALKKMVAEVEMVDTYKAEDVIAFIDKQIELIDNKAAGAKKKAAKQKEAGDALRDAIEVVLTEEYQTIDTIVEQVDIEGVTKSKVTARLTQLVAADVAEKAQVKEEGTNRKVMAYKLKAEVEDTEVEVEVNEQEVE